MSNINYAYNGRKYTYGYMVKNFDRADPNAITKVRKLVADLKISNFYNTIK